jgi:signal transduction histidine kinase
MRRLFTPLWQGATYARALYLLLGLPLGVFYFTFLVTAISVGGGLLIIWVGVPILAGTVIAWRAMGTFERLLLSGMAGANIDPPQRRIERGMSLGRKARALLSDSYTWRSLGWLLLRFPLGIAGFVVVVVLVSVSLSLLVAPLALIWQDQIDLGWGVRDNTGLLWLGPVAGLILAPVSAHIISGFGRLHGLMARPLLGPSGEQERAELRQRTTVLEQRTQLAHELHDSVGHTLTMMVVQAGAGHHVFDADPEFSRQALGNIETSGRRALGELDRILGILRDDDDSELTPQPTVERIPDLIAEMTTLGADVTLTVEGNVGELPTEVDRSAFRIIQEALTNVVKHAGSAPAQVALHRSAGALELEVLNEAPGDGRVPAKVDDTGSGGRGLIGIRERVAMLGGSVETGIRPGGGFRLWARLPIDSART